MLKILLKTCLLSAGICIFAACATEKDHLVTIKTKFGDMRVILYNETPQHKENFLKLAEEGLYDSTSFHRVIKNFMVQGGDINAKEGMEGEIDYTIPAEINEQFLHEKGALSAARQGDQVNLEKASSGSQFYIVHGQVFSDEAFAQLEHDYLLGKLQGRFVELLGVEKYARLREEYIEIQRSGDQQAMIQKILDSREIIENEYGEIEDFQLTESQKEAYSTIGGAPHLDREYTVFGKVVEGLNVIDSIAMQVTGAGDKPVEDVFMTMEVEEMSKKKITELYGYQYPEAEEEE